MTNLDLKLFIATVVIPAHNRNDKLERAVISVLSQPGAGDVEIIVVDDCSQPPLVCDYLRPQDKLLRNEVNRGAPASRNIGIHLASGKLIYLLDSDDVFLQRDFSDDYLKYGQSEGLYYVDILRGGTTSDFPPVMQRADFVPYAMAGGYPLIGQTSSLMFNSLQRIFFDESLPKHQDWDLVLNYLSVHGPLKKIDGMIEYDEADAASLSRTYAPEKSLPWLNKVKTDPALGCSPAEVRHMTWLILNYSTRHYAWTEWLTTCLAYLTRGKLSPWGAFKSFYLRLTKETIGAGARRRA